MKTEGPPLETLTRRLAECPADFLAEPRIGVAGKVQVAAVVADLLREMGGSPPRPEQVGVFRSRNARADRNRLSLVLIASWLLADAAFKRSAFAGPALEFLSRGVVELATHTSADKFVIDPDRREELARFCLRALDLRPAGESIAQAQDRLATLNTTERQRVILAAREAEARARAIREAMAQRAAEEANSKLMRE